MIGVLIGELDKSFFGTGVNNGSNIPVAKGWKYNIYFNDITGDYSFNSCFINSHLINKITQTVTFISNSFVVLNKQLSLIFKDF